MEMAGSSSTKTEPQDLSDSDIEIIDVIEVKKEKENVVKIKKEIKIEPKDSHGGPGPHIEKITNTVIDPDFPGQVDVQCDMNPTLNRIIQLSEANENVIDEEEYFECDMCLMKFESQFSLDTHVNVLHTEEKGGYNCDQCNLELANRRDYINHRNTHARRKLSSSQSLQHWLTSYDKEYECNICFMKFEDVKVLAAHKMSHLPQAGFKCRFCNLRLKTRHLYHNHIKTHMGQKPHKCKECSATFLYKSHLKKHQVFHSSKRYYQCDTCLYIFKLKSDIEKHVQIHMK